MTSKDFFFQVVKDLGLDDKDVDRLLDTSVRIVEARNKTVHCLTPDCKGFWFVEPEDADALVHCKVNRIEEKKQINEFHRVFSFQSCKHWICLACKAIHEGKTCRMQFFLSYLFFFFNEKLFR